MAFKPPKPLKIISWNANGISNKLHELEYFAQECKADVICIQESKLNKRTPPKIPNYLNFNLPKSTSGGLLTYYKKHLQPILIPTNTVHSETLAIKINSVTIVNFYNHFQSPINIEELQILTNLDSKTIVVGDFNAKHSHWRCQRADRNGTLLYNYLQNSNTTLHFPLNSYTYYPPRENATPSTIDLIVNKNCNVSQPFAYNALDSDHLPVAFQISGVKNLTSTPPKFKHYTDWSLFTSKVYRQVQLNPNITSKADIDHEISVLTQTIQRCFKQATTSTPIKQHSLVLPPHIINLIKLKNKLRKQLQQNFNHNLHSQYKHLKNLIQALISSIKTAKWEKFTRDMSQNSSTMWRTFKTLKCKQHASFGVTTLHSDHGMLFDDSEKANHIAETYFKAHNSTKFMSDRHTQTLVQNTLQDFQSTAHITPIDMLTTPKEVNNIIRKTNNKKAPGEDKINNRILKELPRKAKMQLFYILNACLKLQYFPTQWKNGIVLPFIKPSKDPKFASNYRPISLLPTMSKVLEKLILIRLQKFQKANNSIIDEQYGFRASHSTHLQLANITNKITQNFNLNKVTAVLSLDIEKAFDTVWHSGLVYKLIQHNLPPYLISLCISYLQNRTFQVKVGKELSVKTRVPAGVPQGGLLSPNLFLFYLNDIPKSSKTSISLFADDTAIIAESWKANMANKYLQSHINVLQEYYDKWKIKINPNKTTLVHFTTKSKEKANINVSFNGQIIQEQKELKYLGLTLNKNLTFSSHIKNTLKKANAALNATYPLISKFSKIDLKHKLRLYNQGIKPILLYANPIWSKTYNRN